MRACWSSVTALAAALVLVAPMTAQASDTRSTQTMSTQTTTTPMEIIGFDPKVAATNGYETRVNPAGQSVTVKIGQPTSSGMVIPTTFLAQTGALVPTPMGTVSSSCGTSSVFLANPLDLKYKLDTGWAVISPAISYSWAVLVTGPGGYSKTHKWGGGLLMRSTWAASVVASISASQRGDFRAYASGTVLFANGFTCRSTNPTDIEYIL